LILVGLPLYWYFKRNRTDIRHQTSTS
jgi:hypothetical protein